MMNFLNVLDNSDGFHLSAQFGSEFVLNSAPDFEGFTDRFEEL
jgi:hypothetical protein